MALLAPVLIWLLACSSSPVAGYPNGKVTSACSSMEPEHEHYPKSRVIHNITVDKTVFGPGDRIKVTLSGSRFTGFFIQARNANNLDGNAVGAFSLIHKDISQLLKCGRVQDSAVSHTSKRRKEQVEFYWIAPSSCPQHIQFLATVVEKYSVYWVKIPGPIISQSGVPLITNKPQTTTLPPSPPIALLTKEFSSSECGSRKFCVRNPTSCDPQQDPCFFLSFRKEGDSMLIEMSGPVKGYLAFALSHDQWMGDDDVYLCGIQGQSVKINPGYNTGRTHPDVTTPDKLRDMAWRIEDGILQCSFRRNLHIPDSPKRFPLDGSYYIFIADGDADEDGTLQRHQRQPLVTGRMYNVARSVEDVGGSRSPLLMKFHGAMMFIAWMTTVSIGVLVARFFKPVWPESTLCGEKIWFQVHRLLMITTVVLTVAAFVLPFLYRGHWSARAGCHPYLGCVVMALTFLQLLIAISRPQPYSRKRPLFNWTHWATGTVARIVAVAAMFLGMDLPALNLPDPWDTYTMVGFVLWHVFIDILLEVHCFCRHEGSGKLLEDRVQMLKPSRAKDDGHTFKKIVLTIYICGNAAFLITFLAAIYQL
ncbi:putative ferric-chelate reductase 1 [Eleutherodactylus coqui]|uniref:putative ferric-chelate reductase 1 n=1 Tax=Eleutherodactylus coqui TaxID=57060 RepID=UPI003461ACFB